MTKARFKATCKKGRWVPVGELTPEQYDKAPKLPATDLLPERLDERWDKKLKTDTAPVYCELETEDRGEFERHMRDVHDGGLYRWDNGSLSADVREVRNYSPRMALPIKLWPATPKKGRPDGAPFKSKVETKTCSGCGLILEDDGTHAAGLYLLEHETLCAGFRIEAAS